MAVVVDDDGRAAATLHAAADDEECWALLENVDGVHGLDCALVVSDDLLKADDAICRFALERGHELWAAPRPLVEAIRLAAGLVTSARVAAMLARLAILPGLRTHLRRVDHNAHDRRQLPLL
ncbi:MAG: hypothetical protein M3Q39_08130 [Actinomycetota bacterium]|nr:hypothetical protein [Actinomycetota bacterium]